MTIGLNRFELPMMLEVRHGDTRSVVIFSNQGFRLKGLRKFRDYIVVTLGQGLPGFDRKTQGWYVHTSILEGVKTKRSSWYTEFDTLCLPEICEVFLIFFWAATDFRAITVTITCPKTRAVFSFKEEVFEASRRGSEG